MNKCDDPILLAPAGNFESLQAAIDNGADAVYFGIGALNMRSRAAVNFTEGDLPEILERCHARGVEAWMALNIIVYDAELPEVTRLCQVAKASGVDAIIAADMAVILAAREVGLSVHISVQANIGNISAVRYYAQFADVLVLARELSLEQIEAICRAVREERIIGPSGKLLRIEVFAHGALCVAISGKCYMSLAVFGSSANRGACFQNCRRKYTVRDTEKGYELDIDNQYVMSPKDLCTVGFLDRILDSGVSVLKLEGRGRSADYVATVTRVYRQALDAWRRGEPFDQEALQRWEEQLATVFNHGFWQGGYYLGKPLGEWAGTQENQATELKVMIGVVLNYYAKPQVAEILLQANQVHEGDRLLVTGPSTGAQEILVENMLRDGKHVTSASQGDDVTFKCPVKLRPNDKVYVKLPK